MLDPMSNKDKPKFAFSLMNSPLSFHRNAYNIDGSHITRSNELTYESSERLQYLHVLNKELRRRWGRHSTVDSILASHPAGPGSILGQGVSKKKFHS